MGDLLIGGDLLGGRGDLDLLLRGDLDLLAGDLENDRLLLRGGGDILLLFRYCGDLLLHLGGGDLEEYLLGIGDLDDLLTVGGEFLANPGGGLVGSKNGVTTGGECFGWC